MVEFFRFFRLGIVNLIGITFPGLLIIFFALIGITPIIILSLNLASVFISDVPANILELLNYSVMMNKAGIVFFYIIFAYIIGSILRLSSPDELDRISSDKVLREMFRENQQNQEHMKNRKTQILNTMKRSNPGIAQLSKVAEDDHWPYRGEPGNKFPYYHFRDYLNSRKLRHLARLVEWGKPDAIAGSVRTKTLVNMMKLEVTSHSPELGAVIESNEAHIRLSFGIWKGIKTSAWIVFLGYFACLVGIGLSPIIERALTHVNSLFILLGISLYFLQIGMTWATDKLEKLFHYQRIRELTHIVGAKYYLMRKIRNAK